MRKNILKKLAAFALAAAMVSVGLSFMPHGTGAAESSFKFSRAFTGIQARLLARLFNTSSSIGHDHDGTDSAQLSASSIGDDSITSAKIAAGEVDTSELRTDSVTSAKVGAGEIGVSEIRTDAVTTPKVAASAITTAKTYLDLIEAKALCVTSAKRIGQCSDAIGATGFCTCSS